MSGSDLNEDTIDQRVQQWASNLNTYTMLMHLSQFAVFILPGIGWIAPIIMWAIKRDQQPVDRHGKFIFNWMISITLYSIIIFAAFWFMPLLAIPVLVLIAMASVVMIILSAVNAKNGQQRPYPLCLPIFKTRQDVSCAESV